MVYGFDPVGFHTESRQMETALIVLEDRRGDLPSVSLLTEYNNGILKIMT